MPGLGHFDGTNTFRSIAANVLGLLIWYSISVVDPESGLPRVTDASMTKKNINTHNRKLIKILFSGK